MKVHPLPKKRNNITIQFYDQREDPLLSSSGRSQNKKLRRLPHIFSRVLELPFRSDADVSVEESPDCFRFVAETDNNIGEVRAHTVEIYPGVTKIVIRPNGYLELSSLDDLELDMWRFRLPETTRPELASAVLADGELIVTVPKGEEVEEEGSGNNNNGEFRGGFLFCNSVSCVVVEQQKWILCVFFWFLIGLDLNLVNLLVFLTFMLVPQLLEVRFLR
ncbi:unnamed protein product [Dovyalis caffra]|uniref:SHSP domain-containing protein n=1 Tax=Dovyalis caffra TaxID=77055 RepID=A0AAV1R3Q3_9ROSI|nr:unnamed protein product [Dovyalis caffra]